MRDCDRGPSLAGSAWRLVSLVALGVGDRRAAVVLRVIANDTLEAHLGAHAQPIDAVEVLADGDDTTLAVRILALADHGGQKRGVVELRPFDTAVDVQQRILTFGEPAPRDTVVSDVEVDVVHVADVDHRLAVDETIFDRTENGSDVGRVADASIALEHAVGTITELGEVQVEPTVVAVALPDQPFSDHLGDGKHLPLRTHDVVVREVRTEIDTKGADEVALVRRWLSQLLDHPHGDEGAGRVPFHLLERSPEEAKLAVVNLVGERDRNVVVELIDDGRGLLAVARTQVVPGRRFPTIEEEHPLGAGLVRRELDDVAAQIAEALDRLVDHAGAEFVLREQMLEIVPRGQPHPHLVVPVARHLVVRARRVLLGEVEVVAELEGATESLLEPAPLDAGAEDLELTARLEHLVDDGDSGVMLGNRLVETPFDLLDPDHLGGAEPRTLHVGDPLPGGQVAVVSDDGDTRHHDRAMRVETDPRNLRQVGEVVRDRVNANDQWYSGTVVRDHLPDALNGANGHGFLLRCPVMSVKSRTVTALAALIPFQGRKNSVVKSDSLL